LTRARYERLLAELQRIPDLVEQILASSGDIQQLAKKLTPYSDFFFL
jgi:glucosamine 6-phosphate synthetase-like amidotransferase/phosphosugar isomerase protein